MSHDHAPPEVPDLDRIAALADPSRHWPLSSVGYDLSGGDHAVGRALGQRAIRQFARRQADARLGALLIAVANTLENPAKSMSALRNAAETYVLAAHRAQEPK